jgi:excisionase family DNA binding protein
MQNNANIKYMTTQEVADLMGVHYKTVRNWIKSGILKSKQPCKHGRILITQKDIDRMMK